MVLHTVNTQYWENKLNEESLVYIQGMSMNTNGLLHEGRFPPELSTQAWYTSAYAVHSDFNQWAPPHCGRSLTYHPRGERFSSADSNVVGVESAWDLICIQWEGAQDVFCFCFVRWAWAVVWHSLWEALQVGYQAQRQSIMWSCLFLKPSFLNYHYNNSRRSCQPKVGPLEEPYIS